MCMCVGGFVACHFVVYLRTYVRIQWNLSSGTHWDPAGCPV